MTTYNRAINPKPDSDFAVRVTPCRAEAIKAARPMPNEHGAIAGSTDLASGTVYVPMAETAEGRTVRLHEAMHAAFTPKECKPRDMLDQALEDARLHRYFAQTAASHFQRARRDELTGALRELRAVTRVPMVTPAAALATLRAAAILRSGKVTERHGKLLDAALSRFGETGKHDFFAAIRALGDVPSKDMTFSRPWMAARKLLEKYFGAGFESMLPPTKGGKDSDGKDGETRKAKAKAKPSKSESKAKDKAKAESKPSKSKSSSDESESSDKAESDRETAEDTQGEDGSDSGTADGTPTDSGAESSSAADGADADAKAESSDSDSSSRTGSGGGSGETTPTEDIPDEAPKADETETEDSAEDETDESDADEDAEADEQEDYYAEDEDAELEDSVMDEDAERNASDVRPERAETETVMAPVKVTAKPAAAAEDADLYTADLTPECDKDTYESYTKSHPLKLFIRRLDMGINRVKLDMGRRAPMSASTGRRVIARKLAAAITTPGTRVFSRHIDHGGNGTIVIDASGSMSIPESVLCDFLAKAPALTLAFYNAPHDESSHGSIFIYAANGYRANVSALVTSDYGIRGLPEYGSGNVIDYQVMAWLLKQPAPRYLVTDQGWTGPWVPACSGLARKLKASRQVTIVPNLHEMRAILSNSKRKRGR